MRKALVVGLLRAAWPAAAQQVIVKCRGPKGETIYQNRPCAWRGGTMEDVLVFDDPRDSPEARRRLDAIEQAQQARYREERRAAGSNLRPPVVPSPRDRQRAECTAPASARTARRSTARRMRCGRPTSGMRWTPASGCRPRGRLPAVTFFT